MTPAPVNPGSGKPQPEPVIDMAAVTARLITAGAPTLPAGMQYEATCAARGNGFRVAVEIASLDSSNLYAAVERQHGNPAVADIVELAKMAHRKAFPEAALSAAVRELLYGPVTG